MGYVCKIYLAPGPDGGNTMIVESGGVVQFATSECIEINGEALEATAAELNILDGVTASTAELNILDGVTATAAELSKLASSGATVASGTQAAHIVDIAVDANGTAIATAVNAIIAALEAFGITASA